MLTVRTDTITITVTEADRTPTLQATLEVKALESVTLAVANIVAAADKNISLRQKVGEELEFVTLIELSDSTDVIVDG